MLACHGVLCHVLILALQLGFGMSAQNAAERFLLDGRPGVVLAPGKPCCFPYVDNGNVACWDAVDAEIMHSSFVAILDSLGILTVQDRMFGPGSLGYDRLIFFC